MNERFKSHWINCKTKHTDGFDQLKNIPGNRILLDHYLDKAIEAEVDAICDGKDVYIIGVMEHVEPCGIHSGDSSAVLPPFDLSDKIIQDMINYKNDSCITLQRSFE